MILEQLPNYKPVLRWSNFLNRFCRVTDWELYLCGRIGPDEIPQVTFAQVTSEVVAIPYECMEKLVMQPGDQFIFQGMKFCAVELPEWSENIIAIHILQVTAAMFPTQHLFVWRIGNHANGVFVVVEAPTMEQAQEKVKELNINQHQVMVCDKPTISFTAGEMK